MLEFFPRLNLVFVTNNFSTKARFHNRKKRIYQREHFINNL